MSHKWYQRHDWETVNAMTGTGLSSIAEGSTPRLITVVLFRCACGKFKTETFNGHWEPKDFGAAQPAKGEREL